MTTSRIHVFFIRGKEKLFMGDLALKNRRIFFEYNPEFLQTGLELSPFKLPLRPGIISCEGPIFEGLFGIFNDSIPDGWGRLLLHRKLAMLGIDAHALSPLDLLSYVGHQGMGALVYEPEMKGSSPVEDKELDELAEEASVTPASIQTISKAISIS